MTHLSEKIADRLDRKLASDQIHSLIQEADARHRELVQHLNQSSTISGRRELVLATDPATLAEREREDGLLEAEAERLYELLGTLRARHRTALIDEAPARARASIKRIGPAVKELQAARAAYQEARREVQAAVGELSQARKLAPPAERYKVALDEATFAHVADLLDWSLLDPLKIKISHRDLCGPTQHENKAMNRKSKQLKPDDLFMERDGQVIAIRPDAFFKCVNQGYKPLSDREDATRRWRAQQG